MQNLVNTLCAEFLGHATFGDHRQLVHLGEVALRLFAHAVEAQMDLLGL